MDHFVRQSKREQSLKDHLQKQATPTTDLRRSKLVLANKIENQVKKLAEESGFSLDIDTQLNYLGFLEMMIKMGYFYQLQDAEKKLVDDSWQLLKVNDGVGLANLIKFAIAVSGIYVDKLSSYPVLNREKRLFGYVVND